VDAVSSRNQAAGRKPPRGRATPVLPPQEVRERRGQNLPVGLRQTRRHLTVARRRRSVKEPERARSSQRPSDPRRWGSIRCAPDSLAPATCGARTGGVRRPAGVAQRLSVDGGCRSSAKRRQPRAPTRAVRSSRLPRPCHASLRLRGVRAGSGV